jgi:hypothetical protein
MRVFLVDFPQPDFWTAITSGTVIWELALSDTLKL